MLHLGTFFLNLCTYLPKKKKNTYVKLLQQEKTCTKLADILNQNEQNKFQKQLVNEMSALQMLFEILNVRYTYLFTCKFHGWIQTPIGCINPV